MRRREFLGCVAAATIAAGKMDAGAIGANTAITGYSLDAAIELLARLRIPVIEIHPMGVPEATPDKFPGFEFDRLSDSRKRHIKASLGEFQHVTAHLPYAGLRYMDEDAERAAESIRKMEVALESCAYFGVSMAVLHLLRGEASSPGRAWDVMVERIRKWGDIARRNRCRIAMETGYPSSVRDFARLVREVDHPAVGATIDVGHQSRYEELVGRVKPEDRATPAGIRAYNDTTLALVEQLGAKVLHFHVHDIEPETWREHKPFGTGFVDYTRLMAKLREIRYDGFLVMEIGAPAAEMEGHLREGVRVLRRHLGIGA